MTKDDIKKYLKENGTSDILIQMPAVMERVYSYFETVPESIYSGYTGTIIPMGGLLPKQLKKMLLVETNGNITIKNGADIRRFEVRPDGEAVYINADSGIMGIDEIGEYQIDKYGMDKSFEGNDGIRVTRTDNGRITGKKQEFVDDGSPILNAGYFMDKRPSRDSEKDEAWEVNKDEITSNYPNTKEWYDAREDSRKNRDNRQEEIVIRGLVEDRTDKLNIPMPKEIEKKNNDDSKEKDATISYLQKKDKENGETIITLRNSNQQKEERIEELERQNDEKDAQIQELQEETLEREQRIADLQTRNSSLQERNTKLQQMLTTALNKLQQIKSSIFGRFFFTKEERRDAKKAKKLTDGTEQSIER